MCHVFLIDGLGGDEGYAVDSGDGDAEYRVRNVDFLHYVVGLFHAEGIYLAVADLLDFIVPESVELSVIAEYV